MSEGEKPPTEWQPPKPPGPPPPTWEPPAPPGPPPPPYEPPAQQPPPPGYDAPAETETPPAEGTWAGKPLAGWWSRVGAALLDGLIVGIPVAAIALAVDPLLGIVLGATASLTYYPLLMIRGGEANGQTLGKQVVGIRAVLNTGESFTYGPAALREFVIKYLLFSTVGGFFLAIPTLVNYLWPLWDDENRALHDMLASTHVVQA
jgi:uncharacterized RDD family membrane protein YckC